MPRKVAVPKPVALSTNRLLSPDVEAEVGRVAALENVLLPPERRTGTNIQSITTDVEGLAYISDVNARILAATSGNWIQIVAALFGLLTFLFFASLVIASVLGKPVPPDSRLLVVAVLAIGIALSISFLGGTAFVSGKLGNMPRGIDPVVFRAGGGVAVFILVFLIGYLAYVRPGEDAVTLAGIVLDANSSAGISTATVIIKTDVNIYERRPADGGDFRISDIPHLFNQQVTVSARADNYRPATPQTVVIGSYVQHFKLEMYNCYNGVWHENASPSGLKGSQWRFKLVGPSRLHVSRVDASVSGDFHRGVDGNWTGDLYSGNGKKTPRMILEAPNASCDQIFTNQSWSYARDTFE